MIRLAFVSCALPSGQINTSRAKHALLKSTLVQVGETRSELKHPPVFKKAKHRLIFPTWLASANEQS
jgi:hypothetical protein